MLARGAVGHKSSADSKPLKKLTQQTLLYMSWHVNFFLYNFTFFKTCL